MANEDETTGANKENEEAAKESRVKRARGKVVDYADADDTLKALMEKIMDPIDKAPDSFEAIITYGHPPLRKLGDIANEMIKVQGKFNEQVNVMAGAMDKLQSGLSGMNLEKLGENTRALLKSLGEVGVKGAKGGASLIKNFFNAITGKSKKKSTEEEKMIKEMQEALPEMLGEMLKLVNNIEETDKGIVQVMKEAEKLGMARVECTREISVYLGASK